MNLSLRQTLIFSSTLALSTFVFYPFFGGLSFIFIGVTLFHELGHYLTALHQRVDDVRLPVFIPIPPLLLGMTYVEGDYNKALVAYAGPIAGSVAALLFAIGSAFLGSTSALFVSLSLFLVQFSSLYFSSDAKKARRWLRKQNRI